MGDRERAPAGGAEAGTRSPPWVAVSEGLEPSNSFDTLLVDVDHVDGSQIYSREV